MPRNTKISRSKQPLFEGIDLHKTTWHVTIRTAEAELLSGSIPGAWASLQSLLQRYSAHPFQVVYEAGYFGFWLHDRLVDYGAGCVVTPPSLVPIEYGNKVKTDRRDSRQLAHFLAKGLLKAIAVPSEEERYHRQVVRRRRQLIGDRVRTQNRIKAELPFYGVPLASPRGKWSKTYLANLHRLRFGNRWMQESFHRLLEEYEFLSGQVEKQTRVLKELAETEDYRDQVALLRSIPGMGLIVAMELLLELQDVARFRRVDQREAYLGLTPAQYSSGDKVRMDRITGLGKRALRGLLVEVAWKLITKDPALRRHYERLKERAGSKRAIIAITRKLAIRTRRMLLDQTPYALGPAA